MNNIQLIRRLTADPELGSTNGGNAVCTIRLAVPRHRRRGEAEPAPVYVKLVTYGAKSSRSPPTLPRAGGCRDWSARAREWITDSVRHSIHEVIAAEVAFLDAAPKDAPGTTAGPRTDDYGE